ncbi:type II secretion system protein [Vibrio sagamiensis]|uniref:Type II secretion system protein n=1 Tax=Vibrio sagamiensis NBRC 104589 TaxID=1219064 RepID=A0A511QJW0_9VIBR|nr:type II secretion system protein [Vibrio sagamiensis]PNQ71052.1 type II secretion system protein [Vibrio agarivorans]PNQ71103.1 type II secretion system protein [Vibrio agarivorans]GEM77614.1 hypothetical protein VSA01S_37260 [Vibrio sagamiensis NBRC 104589]
MNLRHKQHGFALIMGVLIILTIVGAGSMAIAEYTQKKRILNNAESFYNRVLYLRRQMHAYAHDKYTAGFSINSAGLFPFNLSDLEGKYVPACSTADNRRGLCMKINQTPWGTIERNDYRVVEIKPSQGESYYRAEIDLKLPSKTDETLRYERNTTISMLAQLPNIQYDDTSNMIKVRVDRPDKAFGYESLVKRSGDSTLLGDWDVGGQHAITNARDVTIANDDGTQKLVSRGLSNVYTVEHGDKVKKPSCPKDLNPRIDLGLGYVRIESDYQLIGSQKPHIVSETTSDWEIGLALRVKNIITNEIGTQSTGNVLAVTQCK